MILTRMLRCMGMKKTVLFLLVFVALFQVFVTMVNAQTDPINSCVSITASPATIPFGTTTGTVHVEMTLDTNITIRTPIVVQYGKKENGAAWEESTLPATLTPKDANTEVVSADVPVSALKNPVTYDFAFRYANQQGSFKKNEADCVANVLIDSQGKPLSGGCDFELSSTGQYFSCIKGSQGNWGIDSTNYNCSNADPQAICIAGNFSAPADSNTICLPCSITKPTNYKIHGESCIPSENNCYVRNGLNPTTTSLSGATIKCQTDSNLCLFDKNSLGPGDECIAGQGECNSNSSPILDCIGGKCQPSAGCTGAETPPQVETPNSLCAKQGYGPWSYCKMINGNGQCVTGGPPADDSNPCKAVVSTLDSLCNQIQDRTLQQNCKTCGAKYQNGNSKSTVGGVWTAFGCIPTNYDGLIANLISVGLNIAGGAALIFILAAALILTTSQGEPKRTEQAREILTSAVIGLLFIIFSVVLLRYVGVTVLHLPGFGDNPPADKPSQSADKPCTRTSTSTPS